MPPSFHMRMQHQLNLHTSMIAGFACTTSGCSHKGNGSPACSCYVSRIAHVVWEGKPADVHWTSGTASRHAACCSHKPRQPHGCKPHGCRPAARQHTRACKLVQQRRAQLPVLRGGRPEVAQRRLPGHKAERRERGVAQLMRISDQPARRLGPWLHAAVVWHVRQRVAVQQVLQALRGRLQPRVSTSASTSAASG